MFDVKKAMELQTPCYIINMEKFRSNVDVFKSVFSGYLGKSRLQISYSLKTNHRPEFLAEARTLGMYLEVVSDDEYQYGLSCGFKPDEIVFNGPQKSPEQLIQALAAGSIVNIDSLDEIEMIEQHVHQLSCGDVNVGLRVNFDLEELCGNETIAGKDGSQFGICFENGDLKCAVDRLHAMGIRVKGLHAHYNTKTKSVAVFRHRAQKCAECIRQYALEEELDYIDIGGGFFLGESYLVPGRPTLEEYAQAIFEELKFILRKKELTLILEPGMSLIAATTYYLTKIIREKHVREATVLIADGFLGHVRPRLNAENLIDQLEIVNEGKKTAPKVEKQIICGSTCMDNDRFFKVENWPKICKGEYLLFHNVGAYTMSFNSSFINALPAIYIQDRGVCKQVRKKYTADERSIMVGHLNLKAFGKGEE